MKRSFLFVILFSLTTILTVILIFFLNKFLFYINGYHTDLIGVNSVESGEAYKHVYPSKVALFFGGFVVSAVTLILFKKTFVQNGLLSFLIYGVCGLMAIIFLIHCFFFFLLPHNSLV